MLQSLCLFTNWLCKNWKKFLVDVTLVKMLWQPSSYPQLLSLNLFPVLTRCASKIHLYSISILVILDLLSSQPTRCSRRHFPLPPHAILIFILSSSLSNSYLQRLITAIMRLRDCWLQWNLLLIPLLTSQLSLLMLPLVLIFTTKYFVPPATQSLTWSSLIHFKLHNCIYFSPVFLHHSVPFQFTFKYTEFLLHHSVPAGYSNCTSSSASAILSSAGVPLPP